MGFFTKKRWIDEAEIDKPDPVYSPYDTSGGYVRRILTEYRAQSLPDGH